MALSNYHCPRSPFFILGDSSIGLREGKGSWPRPNASKAPALPSAILSASHLVSGNLCKSPGPQTMAEDTPFWPTQSRSTQCHIEEFLLALRPQALAKKPLPQQLDLSAGSSAPPRGEPDPRSPVTQNGNYSAGGSRRSKAKEPWGRASHSPCSQPRSSLLFMIFCPLPGEPE